MESSLRLDKGRDHTWFQFCWVDTRNVDDDLTDAIMEGLGRHVSAHGELSRNPLGQPVHMRVDGVRILEEPARPVSLSEIAGIDPGWTGDLTAAEFVRRQRDDWPPAADGPAME
jgi:hypothetical protein